MQEVTGCHTYANLKVGDICGSAGDGSSVVVNAINTSSIVSRNSNVTFVDQKTFQNVEVFRDTNISLINDVSRFFCILSQGELVYQLMERYYYSCRLTYQV